MFSRGEEARALTEPGRQRTQSTSSWTPPVTLDDKSAVDSRAALRANEEHIAINSARTIHVVLRRKGPLATERMEGAGEGEAARTARVKRAGAAAEL